MARPKTFRVFVTLKAKPEQIRNLILTFRHDQAENLVRVTLEVWTVTEESSDRRMLVYDSPVEPMAVKNCKLMQLIAQHHKDDINARTGPGWWLVEKAIAPHGYEIGGEAR